MDKKKVITQIEKCIIDSSCIGCPYEKSLVCRHYMLADALELLKEQKTVKPQDAEMLIIHNGGAEEYVKDIESIVLLAHKDYDIVYCGNFLKGTVKQNNE